jgi:hypothetical protein
MALTSLTRDRRLVTVRKWMKVGIANMLPLVRHKLRNFTRPDVGWSAALFLEFPRVPS